MPDIELNTQTREELSRRLQAYFSEELEVELAGFDAVFLLDFLTKELGPHFYNQGLYDAEAMLSKRMDDITEAIRELEKQRCLHP